MTPVLVFDVNETLLDLSGLDAHFSRIFGTSSIRERWFGIVLRNALCLTITGHHTDFLSVGTASLQMVADSANVVLTDDDRTAVRAAMMALPPHPEVPGALNRLADEGFRLVALTNSPQQGAETQLANAGLAAHFERIMSVEPAGVFKPASAVYRLPADALGVEMNDMTMIAAHDWDIAGAMTAGMRGAFITRPGMVVNPLYPPPDIVGSDLDEIATQLTATA